MHYEFNLGKPRQPNDLTLDPRRNARTFSKSRDEATKTRRLTRLPVVAGHNTRS